MTKYSMLFAALALVVAPACKKKDADTAAKTDQPATPGSAATAPKPTEAPKPEPVKPKTGQELVELYKSCGEDINNNKMDDFFKDCVDPSYVGHDSDGKDQKLDDLKAHFTMMREAFPDAKMTPQIVLVNGRNVFAIGLVQGTNEGTLKHPGMPEVPATHKKIGTLMAQRLAFNDQNKVTEEWSFGMPGTFAAQLGLLPKDAPPKRPAMDKGLEGAPIAVVAADDAKEKTNLEALKKVDDAFNAHKAADLMALYTDDAVESDMSAPKDMTGKKDITKGLEEFLKAFPDAKVTGTDFAAGDYVVDIGTFEGTNTGDMGKMKKTGKHVSLPYFELSQLKDGKVAHVWRFMNDMAFAKQLGLIPDAPPAGAAPADKKDEKAGDKKPDDKKPADKKPAGAKK